MFMPSHKQRRNRRERKIVQILKRIYKNLYKHFGSQHWWPGDSPFEVMVGAILTQNTNWHNVQRAIDNIKRRGLLSPNVLLKKKTSIPSLIQSSGFYNVKSKRLISFLRYFVNSYSGNTQHMRKKNFRIVRDELLKVNGIGMETADSMLLYALGKPVFVVDTYTRRIFSRHGIINKNADYDDIRFFFESHLPRRVRLYNEYHALLVRTGKEYCRKNEPLCHHCPLCHLKRSI